MISHDYPMPFNAFKPVIFQSIGPLIYAQNTVCTVISILRTDARFWWLFDKIQVLKKGF